MPRQDEFPIGTDSAPPTAETATPGTCPIRSGIIHLSSPPDPPSRGTRKPGIILVTLPDGTVTELQYRVYVEKGRTGWREYVINDRLYSRQNA